MNNFKLISRNYLNSLDIYLEHYIHEITGAEHYHFDAKNSENVFMVALRTMPNDSTGVAHILEHTALCGSKNYNVRDPFFSMLRRSMQTFMNAFTSSDWTAYPFATENKKDFNNLLKVYLDAVFFPNLNRLDFLQEGHRFDFDENENLVLKGVVFNEMKWVYGSIFSRIYELNKALIHPETTYHYDSGGYPQVIPNLTYENFLAFHKKHYHPTNATFFTFGDIKALEHQENFENLVLKFFPSKWEKVTTTDETRYLSPVRTSLEYPSTDKTDKTHVIFSWLLGPAHETMHNLEARILYSYLLGHSGSPLSFALQNSDFIENISPLSMLDDSGREFRFYTGAVVESPDLSEKVENLVFETLNNIISNPIDKEEIFGIIDKIEVSIRELSSSYPYGLSLMLQAIGATTHDENVVSILDPTAELTEIRKLANNGDFIANLIKKYILENKHFTRLTAIPSEQAVIEEQNLEKKFLQKKSLKLTPEQKLQIQKDAQDLENRQNSIDDLSVLPKIEVSDIPFKSKPSIIPEQISPQNSHYNVGTNWLDYLKIFFPISGFSKEEIFELSLTDEVIWELGYGSYDYVQAQKQIAKTMNFGTDLMIFRWYNQQKLNWFFTSSIRFLPYKKQNSLKLLSDILTSHKFDEISQIRNIFNEKLLTLKTNLVESGQRTAMLRAGSNSNILAYLGEETGGLSSVKNLENFLAKSDEEISAILQKNYQKLLQNSPKIITAWEKLDFDFTSFTNSEITQDFISNPEISKNPINEAWLTDLTVGYCAVSIPAIPAENPDSALLSLLAQILRDGYLHSAIREKGGAYGSGAVYDSASESFKFFSYRDPRIEWTFADFENSIKWFLENNHDSRLLDEAKIGVIAKADVPGSPVKEAFWSYSNNLKWITDEIRDNYRKIILDANFEDLKRVARDYLSDFSLANRVVITGKQNKNIVEKLGFDVFEF